MTDYNEWSHYAFIMVREGASMGETSLKIHRKLNEEIHQMMNTWFFTINFKLTPMANLHFGKGPQGDSFNHGSYKTIVIYSSIALFILLIAIINFVNLSNATAFRRSREIGLKKLSGAGKSSLLLQLLIESIILSLISICFAWNDYASAFPLEITFMDEAFDKLYKKEERLSLLFGYFSIFAVIIACMGVAGLSVSTMRIKSKEISVRRVFGASVTSIVSRLIWDYARWLLIASVLAYPLAWYFTQRWLSSFAYQQLFAYLWSEGFVISACLR